MKNLSIRTKLLFAFGAVLLMMLLIIGTAVTGINGINGQIDNYAKYTLPNNTSIWVIRRNLVSVQRYIARALSEKNTETISQLFDLAQQDSETLWAEFEKYCANQRDNSHDEGLAQVRDYFTQAGNYRRQIAELMSNPTPKNITDAKQIFDNNYVPLVDAATEIIITFSDQATQNAIEQEQAAEDQVRRAIIMLSSCGVVAIALSLILVSMISGSILKPVMAISHAYEEIAKGNIQTRIDYVSRDELGKLAALIQSTNAQQSQLVSDIIDKFTRIARGDLQLRVELDYPGDYAMIKKAIVDTAAELNQTMMTINNAAEQVNIGSAQVASGAQALSAGSTEQAAAIEELSVSISKIAEQALRNLESAREATANVQQAGDEVNTGNEHMKQLTEAMANIDSASNQIANITKVIEDIAFQTNILALNAAIEAARAGSAGKGFAVVADEVRNLAAKSAEAAKQTAELIQASVATVAEGREISARTADILQHVGTQTAWLIERINSIEQASAEQSTAIEQIRQGLEQVSTVVQTNAATAEENSATSEELSAQAVTLREQVSKFKLAF